MRSMQPENIRKAETAIPIVEYALQYARNGWPVFPLHGKIPFKDSRGYKDATTDEAQIQTWWTTHPTANIGLATDERSGIIVLDIDPSKGGYYGLKELQETYSPLPETRRVSTANKGLHYYFQYPQDNRHTYKNAVGLQGKIGVDVRATGGYVVLPPSKLYGRLSYIWANLTTPIAPLPIWLRDLLIESQQQRESIPQGLRFAGRAGEYWLAKALARAGEGSRNDEGFKLACQLRDDHVSVAEARSTLLSFASQVQQGQEPYTAKEALASVRSAYSRPARERARRR